MTLAQKLLQVIEDISDEKLCEIIDFAEYLKSKELKENKSLIESSLYSGLATFGGKDLYPTLDDTISMY